MTKSKINNNKYKYYCKKITFNPLSLPRDSNFINNVFENLNNNGVKFKLMYQNENKNKNIEQEVVNYLHKITNLK